MEWYNCTCHCGGSMFYKHLHDPSCDLFVHGEEAPQSKEAHLQAALDAERDLRKELATLQAQLEAVRRERDEAKLYLTQERANRDSLAACVDRDVQKIKDLQASLDTEREKYEKQCAGTKSKRERIQSLQQQIDAERTRREQVEMANYAKDGQIETLQAVIVQLRDWRDQVALALTREGGARFEDVPGHVKAMAEELAQLKTLVEEAASAPGKDWLEWQLKLGKALDAAPVEVKG